MSTLNQKLRQPESTAVKAHQTFASVVRSECSKALSNRSTWWLFALAIVIPFALSLTVLIPNYMGASGARGMIMFGAIIASIFGAFVFTREYSTGQIKGSLAAVPKRTRLYLAKIVVTAVFSFIPGFISTGLSIAVYYLLVPSSKRAKFYSGDNLSNSPIDTPSFIDLVMWMVISGVILAFIGLLSLALGQLLRSTAGTISIVMVLLLVVQTVFGALIGKWQWIKYILYALPGSLTDTAFRPFDPAYSALQGSGGTHVPYADGVTWLIIAAWVIIPLILGWITFTKRDA